MGLGLIAAAFGCSSNAGTGGAGGSSPTAGGQAGTMGGAGQVAGTTTSGGAGNLSGAGNAGGGNMAGTGIGASGANPGGAGAAGASSAGAAGSPAQAAGAGGGLGAFMGVDFGAVSDGGTVTYQNIGAMGSYPSVCAPPTAGACCRQTKTITSDKLTPWDEDLIMTLRGPLDIRQFATYQPTVEGQASPWQLVSSFDARTPAASKGIAFSGDAAMGGKTFTGTVASTCLVNASTDKDFGCGPASSPYCSATSSNKKSGWAGSKMFVFLASMPHVGSGGITTDQNCKPTTNGWNDAPWIGLSVGELIRADAFGTCQCYEVTQYHGDGCGQINALEVINDNDTTGNYKNLEIFSSNFFGYGGDFGGPCGTNNCNTTGIPGTVDLVTGKVAAPAGVTGSQTPRMSPNGFLRRPTTGYRYFIVLLDVTTRTVQYAIVHPGKVPAALGSLLPNLPNQVPQSTIDSVIGLRLPK
jgi:Glycine-rich protein domain (DUF2403)/Putative TOS1-like glycosyl hydrolase (DUF2401)